MITFTTIDINNDNKYNYYYLIILKNYINSFLLYQDYIFERKRVIFEIIINKIVIL